MSSTLKLIADKSGCSVATVSRVLRNKGEISAKKRAQVLAAAQALQYRPNMLVRGMQTGKTRMIGVMVPVGGYYSSMVEGIHNELAAQDYVPLLLYANKQSDGSYAGPNELEQLYRLLDRRVEGIILRPVEDDAGKEYFQEIMRRGVPLVCVDRRLDQDIASFFGTDDEAGGRLAAQYLLGLGYRHLGHIAGPSFASSGRLRRCGFEAAVAQCPAARLRVVEDRTFCAGKRAAAELLQGDDRVEAIFCASDDQAAGVYQVARELGLRVPEDISVLGFGNLGYSRHLAPPLSTFDQHPGRIGAAAARALLRMIEQPGCKIAAAEGMFAAELVCRESVRGARDS